MLRTAHAKHENHCRGQSFLCVKHTLQKSPRYEMSMYKNQTLKQDALVIGLVGTAHAVSHFSHLLLASLFPWLKVAFDLSYAELGLLMTVFFIVSGFGQALAGFVVDKVGARTVLFAGIGCMGVAALAM